MAMQKVLLRGFLLIFGLLLIGTIFYSLVEKLPIVDAFYLSGATLTTLGFGDITPITNVGKVFSVFYALAGIGTLFFIMGKLFHIVFSQTLLDPVFHERHQLYYKKLLEKKTTQEKIKKK